MWRWSYYTTQADEIFDVFSTYVEMILNKKNATYNVICVLHVCGDDPW